MRPASLGRRGSSAAELRQELADIADWLAVDTPEHLRYQPRAGLTFCNIYAHDYCHLAGAYLPRVWWSAPALLALDRGLAVSPLIGDTLNEVRANDLFLLAARPRPALRLAAHRHAGQAAASGQSGRGGLDRGVAARKTGARATSLPSCRKPRTGAPAAMPAVR